MNYRAVCRMNYPRRPRASRRACHDHPHPRPHDGSRRRRFPRAGWPTSPPRRSLRRDTWVRSASSDASFRRYFRVDGSAGAGGASFIVMDAPPPQEDVRPFIAGRAAAAAGLQAPAGARKQDVAQRLPAAQRPGLAAVPRRLNGPAARRRLRCADALGAERALVQWQSAPMPAAVRPTTTLLRRRVGALPRSGA